MHLVFVRLSFFVDCLQIQSEYPEISFDFDTLVFIAVLDGNESSGSTEFKSLTSDFQGNELKEEKVSCQGHFLWFSGAGAITCPELCLHHHLEYQCSTRSSWISREKKLIKWREKSDSSHQPWCLGVEKVGGAALPGFFTSCKILETPGRGRMEV